MIGAVSPIGLAFHRPRPRGLRFERALGQHRKVYAQERDAEPRGGENDRRINGAQAGMGTRRACGTRNRNMGRTACSNTAPSPRRWPDEAEPYSPTPRN